MSTIISTSQIPTATAHVVQAPTEAAQEVPIVRIFRFLVKSVSVALPYTLWFIRFTIPKLAAPISFLLRVISYLLSPVYHFVTALLNVFVVAPYNAMLHLAYDLYPFYVFVVVACLWSAVMGWIARFIVAQLQSSFWSNDPTEFPPTKPSTPTGPSKGRKRVSFKRERHS